MIIGIDGNEANIKNRVGSNIYAFKIIENLYALTKEKKQGVEFIIYLRNKPLADLPPGNDCWKYKVFGPSKFWTQFALPLKLFTQKEKLTVFFTPGHYAPRFSPFLSAISILDTSYLTFPQYFKKDDLYQLKNWTEYSAKKAKIIFTISENSKKDIIRFYQRKPEDIIVVYPGYDKERFDIKIKNQRLKIKNTKQELKINGEYIVYVGTLQPRKNVVRLIEAFKQIQEKYSNLKLIIAGKKGWLYDDIYSRVRELNLEDSVIFTGFVPDSELPYIIAGAKLYILPSLYEGFGIPVIEAMAVGTPVVVSRVSSLPEVVENAGIYIENPLNVQDITESILRGLNLNEKERGEIITKGLDKIKQFNWNKAANQILSSLIKLE